jgi:hypothetical protein
MSASPDGPPQEPPNRPSSPLHAGKSANPTQPSLRTLSEGVRSFQPTLPRKPSQPQPTEPKPAPINQNERPRPDDLRPRRSRLTPAGLRLRLRLRPQAHWLHSSPRRPAWRRAVDTTAAATRRCARSGRRGGAHPGRSAGRASRRTLGRVPRRCPTAARPARGSCSCSRGSPRRAARAC